MAEGLHRCYEPRKFGAAALAMIDSVNTIISEYEPRGMNVTVRQIYYQLVQRGMIANKQANYDKVQGIINDGRMAGRISWTAIEDRTRNLRGVDTYTGPAQALRSAATNYRADLWRDQPIRPEVWIEKDALVGVIDGICSRLRVDFYSCRGYNSQSEQWRAGRRFAGYYGKGQRPVVLHLGDHDPSGLDMTRDNRDRLSLFAGTAVQVVRLGLNMEQIQRLQPPPNPAKVTDARFAVYAAEFGEESWELDALPPDELVQVIESAVGKLRDDKLWDAALAREVEDRELLVGMAQEIE